MRRTTILFSLLAASIAGCSGGQGCGGPTSTGATSSGPAPVAPPPSDVQEIDAFLRTPYAVEVGAGRLIELRFFTDGGASAAIDWTLTLLDGKGEVLRTWKDRTSLTANAGTERRTLDANDGGGRPLAAGLYTLALSASASGVSAETDRTIRIGRPPAPKMPAFDRLRSVTNKEESVPAPNELPYTVALGNLHSQTNHSDGGGDVSSCSHSERPQAGTYGPRDAYDYAMHAGLDFLVTSEHNHMYDGSTGLNAHASAPTIQATFADGLKIAADHRAAHPGFLAIYGTEWGVIKQHGHVNVFNPKGLITWEKSDTGDLYGDELVEKDDYRGLYRLMKSRGWVGQFNHPARDQFPIDGNTLAYDPDGDAAIALCEVTNADAFSSAEDEPDGPLSSFEAQWKKLLSNGYHLAPSSDQDNHCANWGRSARNRTGILIPAGKPLSFENIVAAIKARRVFATTDKDSQIVLTTGDGHVMGDRFHAGGDVTLIVNHAHPAARSADRVEIFHGMSGSGDPVKQVGAGEATTTVTPEQGENFYYAKVTEDGGAVLWSAPVWITR